MINSILEDIKNTFRWGNMISRIILVNVIVFVIINLINVFDANSGFAQLIIHKLSIVSDPVSLLLQFWSVITHMFLHVGFWHLLWNMLLLYWFGRIFGDFLGDKRVLPLYILGGLAGAIFFIVWDQFFPGGTGGSAYAYGASAAVWAIIMATTMLAPDYIFHLILIGPVRIKYISLAMLLLDLISTGNNTNTGGFFGHLGGAFFGLLFIYMLRQGTDLSDYAQFKFNTGNSSRRKTPRDNFKVYRNKESGNAATDKKPFKQQEELDRILDKIKAKGYEALTAEEKDFLYQASKKK
jgi:membrane associated rhomboid family serine protease